MKLMSLKFAAKCRCCGKTVEAGHEAYFDKDGEPGKKVLCLPCHAAPSTPTPSTQEPPSWQPPAPDASLRYKPSRSYLRAFDSVSEYLTLRASPENIEAFDRSLYSHDSPQDSMDWFGAPSVAAAEAILKKGWHEGADRLSSLTDAYIEQSAACSTKRLVVRGPDGDELDIHRVYCGGLDTAWKKRVRRSRSTPPQITLAALIGVSSGKSAEQAFWRGAAVARLCDLLCSAGYAVGLYGVVAGYGLMESGDERSVMAHTFPIKQAEMPLDICSVATTVCFPGFFRIAGFRGICSHSKKVQGSFLTVGPKRQREVAEYAMRALVGIPAVMVPSEIYDKASADAWIESTVAALNSGQLSTTQQ